MDMISLLAEGHADQLFGPAKRRSFADWSNKLLSVVSLSAAKQRQNE